MCIIYTDAGSAGNAGTLHKYKCLFVLTVQ